jgi:sulfur carrier protein
VKIELNGEPRELPAGATVADVVRALHLASEAVAVERNLRLVPRGQYEQTLLAEGDRIEVVTLVGGG